ncbi:DUF3515 family protein [Microbacterium sp. T2.11-28]|uniref:DUF3515 family protein n=1 Tax=Microbacterium sp. T2.11-28 TaxID=3041169 RepID=UPI0025409C90|nr:DUF3515 family protein [Microbacterium sp. T2.11-28]
MTRTRRMLRPAAVVGAVAAVVLLTGCATTVSMQPAPEADSPDCAAVTVRLPAEVDGQPRVWTDAQATGAWGAPTTVLLTCGLEPSGPSTLPCETVDGIDWLIDDAEAPRYRFTTFGRTPSVEVYLDYDVVSARSVLGSLSSAVRMLPATESECTDRPSA